jgi:hypothetical protein
VSHQDEPRNNGHDDAPDEPKAEPLKLDPVVHDRVLGSDIPDERDGTGNR